MTSVVCIGHLDVVRWCCFSSDGLKIASGSHDQTVKVGILHYISLSSLLSSLLSLGINNDHKCLKIKQLYCLQRFEVSLHLLLKME
jgi:WD40 repeat protein